MEQIKIDKNIPIPTGLKGITAEMYPFRLMEIGDSILIIGKKNWSKHNSAASAYKLRHSKDFNYTLRKVDKDSWRLWRVPVVE